MSDQTMRPGSQRAMPLAGAWLLMVLGLAACGGGGGAGSGSSAPTAVVNTALSATTVPKSLKQISAFAPVIKLRASQLLSDPSRFKNPKLSYVTVWYEDASGNRQQLLFMRLSALQALEAAGGVSLTVPAHVKRLFFEIYDSGGAATALTGELKP